MYNTDLPQRAELPSSRQLLRSTLLAAASALVLLFTVVLPAEYGLDPSGIGRWLGLTAMGETKARLAREAAQEAASPPPAEQTTPAEPAPGDTPPPAAMAAASGWRDEIRFTLAPGQGTEIKLRMNAGDQARYAWAVTGGVVNHDTHGDGGGRSISYVKGRAVAADEGALVAAFTGHHGWFWRNRGAAEVTVVLRTAGTYSDIQRVK